ncbi:MAG: hypothetical protein C5B47_00850 [Verrucomicrobia bacterium]|nr:MAG: hypothetical protein C5B47_00850 [Verrucomicrobiota bacterium]
MLRSFFILLSFAVVAVLIAGCAQPDLAGAPKESSIPWNRPANWEGAGALGGLGMGGMGSR